MNENKTKVCHHCGAELEDNSIYCNECGEKVEDFTLNERINRYVALEEEFEEDNAEYTENSNSIESEEDMNNQETTEEIKTEEKNIVVTYDINPNSYKNYYENLSKKSGLSVFKFFLVAFVLALMGILLVEVAGTIAVILLCITIVFGMFVIFLNMSNKNRIDKIKEETINLEIKEEEMILKVKSERYEHMVKIYYCDIISLEETDDFFVVKDTEGNNVLIEKKAFEEPVIETIKEKFIYNAKTYNGVVVKKEDLFKGKYIYYNKSASKIGAVEAKKKANNSSFYVVLIFTVLLLLTTGLKISYGFNLIAVPFGIAEIIYIHMINKKVDKKFRIKGENFVMWFFTIFALIVGIIGIVLM